MPIKEQVIKKSALSPTVLIAGGAGFIGSHLAELLLARDVRVIVLDNFRTGKDVYVHNLQSNPKFALFDSDINKGLPENIKSVDYIIHLAGVESYLYSRDEVNLDSLLTNAIGTKNLLDLAQRSEAKFLLVSSIDVYEGLISPIDLEHYFGTTPEDEKRYSLSEAKRFAEALVWEYYKKNQTDVRIVRIPEVYGPRMNLTSSGNLGRFLKSLMDNNDLTVHGEGTEKEYYLYISDVVNGLAKSLFNSNTEGQIFTLAEEEPATVLELAFLSKSLAEGNLEIHFRPKLKSTYKTPRIPDRGDLRALKWEPKVDMKEGIKKTLAWFGHEVNEHSFKPNKLIEQKEKLKEQDNGSKITSLIGIVDKPETKPQEKADTIAPAVIATKPQEPKAKLKLPRFKLPRFPEFKKKNPVQNMPVVTKQKIEKPMSKALLASTAVGVALIVLIITPFVQAAVYTKIGVNSLEKASEVLPQLKTAEAKELTNKAYVNFYKAQKALGRNKWIFTISGNEDRYTTSTYLLSSATYFSKAAYNITKAADPFVTLWEVVKPNTETEFDQEGFLNAKLSLDEAKLNLQKALGTYKNVDTQYVPQNYHEKLNQYENVLELSIENIDTAAALASEVPNLLGAGDMLKRYLILFQNSNEIRPTGGFIGSYAVVEVQNGKITELTIDDIYNPDGQIDVRNIQVDPPATLAELLSEDKYYIRNANWHPDFNKSAEDIKDLYFRVTGKDVDGVLAVDLNFAIDIIKVTGPIYLTAFGEEINENNLYERAQYHSEFNFEEGSNQKRAFLTILGSKLLEGVFALPNEKMPQLMLELNNSLVEKHLLINLSNSAFSSELEKQHWDGGLVETPGDYLYVVNSNVGGTKANYFVQNEMSYEVTSKTRDGLLRGELILNYNHTGTDESWPGGPYKDYIRVLTKDATRLTNATYQIEGQDEVNILKDVVIKTEDGFNSFEYLIEIKPQEKAIVKVYFDLPTGTVINQNNMKYSLLWQKQPGTVADPIEFRLIPPFGLQADKISEVQTVLNTNKFFEFTLK